MIPPIKRKREQKGQRWTNPEGTLGWGEKPRTPESWFPPLTVAGLWLVTLTPTANVTVRTKMLNFIKLT